MFAFVWWLFSSFSCSGENTVQTSSILRSFCVSSIHRLIDSKVCKITHFVKVLATYRSSSLFFKGTSDSVSESGDFTEWLRSLDQDLGFLHSSSLVRALENALLSP